VTASAVHQRHAVPHARRHPRPPGRQRHGSHQRQCRANRQAAPALQGGIT